MPPSTPSRKVSPPSTTATPLPLRSPHLHRVQSRSTPAPPVLGLESTSIRDRRHGSRSVSSGSGSDHGSGEGEGGSTIGANEEDRPGYRHEYGHQRRPADGPPTASGPGRNPHLGLGANNPNGILFRSPSSEPSWQAQARRDHQSGFGSSSSGFSSQGSDFDDAYEDEGGKESNYTAGSTFKLRKDREQESGGTGSSATLDGYTYKGGAELGRQVTRQPQVDHNLDHDNYNHNQTNGGSSLRDPYDFDRDYDEYPQHHSQAYREDGDNTSNLITTPRERSTLAGAPLFSAGPEERYELIQKLGHGNFGTVWKA
jgi:hypothetical protein